MYDVKYFFYVKFWIVGAVTYRYTAFTAFLKKSLLCSIELMLFHVLLTFHSNQIGLAVLIQYRRVTDSATQPDMLL